MAGCMPAAGRPARLALAAACLAWAAPLDAAAAAEPYPGFAWMSGAGDGNAVLTYGSTETGEDYLFSLICGNENKGTDATLYVDVTDTNVGQATVIELAAGGAKVSLKGKIATDEMSGFHFANAKKFKIKPVIALLKQTGPVTAKTGKVVETLPEKGRAAEVSAFAKACKLD